LIYNYVFDNGKKPRGTPRKSPFLGPWVKQNPDEVEFKVVHDKDEIEEVLIWAQIAILNPSKDPLTYVPGRVMAPQDQSIQVKFSPNVVSLSVSSPEFIQKWNSA
jgi:hypothetical protein